MVAVIGGIADGVIAVVSEDGEMISIMGVVAVVGEGVTVTGGRVMLQAKNANVERIPMVINAKAAPASQYRGVRLLFTACGSALILG